MSIEIGNAERLALFKVWKERCAWCYLPLCYSEFEVEHLIPKSLATNSAKRNQVLALHKLPNDYDLFALENLAPSCRPCNQGKGRKIPPEAPRISFLLREARDNAPAIRKKAKRFVQQKGIHEALAVIEALPIDLDFKEFEILKKAAESLNRKLEELQEHRIANVHPALTQGATIVPRVLLIVEERRSLGKSDAGADRVPVRSLRSAAEKKPWKNEPNREGVIERQFVRPLISGSSLLPYYVRDPLRVVVPWDGERLLDASDDRLDIFPGLAAWWREAERVWQTQKGGGEISLRDRLDYQNRLSQQFPIDQHRVVYHMSRMHMIAARVSDPSAVFDHTLYWAPASDASAALFLIAVLNSECMAARVRSLQAGSQRTSRPFSDFIREERMPSYQPDDTRHKELATLAAKLETLVESLDTPQFSFMAMRQRVREALIASPAGQRIEKLVSEVLR
ncbi:HNH endonuclease [Streptomyces prasinus]|uniref:HNH endonuclease n=1 Tax=Streptomyces prasinus TaxID=67345 RepID=UPI0037D978D7